MSDSPKSRHRIARVRSVQHRIALLAEQRGRNAVAALDSRSALITRLHATLAVAHGPSSGAALARAAELAGRFAVAAVAVAHERAIADDRLGTLTRQRIASERDRDGADRLARSAQQIQDRTAEKRAARLPSTRKDGQR